MGRKATAAERFQAVNNALRVRCPKVAPVVIPRGHLYTDLDSACHDEEQRRTLEITLEKQHRIACENHGDDAELELALNFAFDFKKHALCVVGAQFVVRDAAGIRDLEAMLSLSTAGSDSTHQVSEFVKLLLRENGHSEEDTLVAQEILCLAQSLKVLSSAMSPWHGMIGPHALPFSQDIDVAKVISGLFRGDTHTANSHRTSKKGKRKVSSVAHPEDHPEVGRKDVKLRKRKVKTSKCERSDGVTVNS